MFSTPRSTWVCFLHVSCRLSGKKKNQKRESRTSRLGKSHEIYVNVYAASSSRAFKKRSTRTINQRLINGRDALNPFERGLICLVAFQKKPPLPPPPPPAWVTMCEAAQRMCLSSHLEIVCSSGKFSQLSTGRKCRIIIFFLCRKNSRIFPVGTFVGGGGWSDAPTTTHCGLSVSNFLQQQA